MLLEIVSLSSVRAVTSFNPASSLTVAPTVQVSNRVSLILD